LPGVRVNRAEYLRKALSKYFAPDVVERAIATSPAHAGISVNAIKPIAKSCVNYETAQVSATSAAAGIPGGFALAGTIPADVVQYFGHIVRVLQKLAYLYGWREMFRDGRDELDDGTANQLTLFVGVMFGVNSANAALAKIAEVAAHNVPEKLMQEVLTKNLLYRIVNQIAKAIGVTMTKTAFTQAVGKVIPVVGAVVSGGVTFATFKPMSNRLRKYLAGLPTATVGYVPNPHENASVLDLDFSDIDYQ